MSDLFDMFFGGIVKTIPQWEQDVTFPQGSLPVNEIHQSWLSQWRKCGKKGELYGLDVKGKKSHHLFGGSVFHVMFDHAAHAPDLEHWLSYATDPRYIDDVFTEVFLRNDKSEYSDDVDVDLFRSRVCSRDTLKGMTLGSIIYAALQFLNGMGFEMLGSEVELSLKPRGGTPFHGTMDLHLRHKLGFQVLGDTKTSGMWDIFFKKGSVKKQSYDNEQVSNHQQLLHYWWMAWRGGLVSLHDVQKFVIFCPSNLTKYVQGANKGQFRGNPFFFGDQITPAHVKRYEQDLIGWLQMIHAGYFPRMYPGLFGKIDCPKCRFKEACLGDKQSEVVPDYIKEATS